MARSLAASCLLAWSFATALAAQGAFDTVTAPIATGKVDTRVEVGLARATLLLLHEDHAGALEELDPIVGSDRSLRARYLRGVTCVRLEDWRCASRDLGIVAASPLAAHFPRLFLELGIARYGSGAWDEARVLLERAARWPGQERVARRYLEELEEPRPAVPAWSDEVRDWSGEVGVGLGFDTNVPFLPSVSSGPCSSRYLGTFDAGRWLDRGCGVSATERLRVAFRPQPPRLRTEAGYQFLHRWYVDRGLDLFDSQDHRVSASISTRSGLSGGYQGRFLALSGRYRPLFASLQSARLRYRRIIGGPARAWVEYRGTWSRYADLSDVWGLEETGATFCPVDSENWNPDGQFCTSARTGFESAGRVGMAYLTPIAAGGFRAAIAWTHAGVLYRGSAATAEVWGDARAGRGIRVRASGRYDVFTYSSRPQAPRVRLFRASLGVAVPIQDRLETTLRYAWDRGRRTGPPGMEADFARHAIVWEVVHGF